jgi:hypothetical protein
MRVLAKRTTILFEPQHLEYPTSRIRYSLTIRRNGPGLRRRIEIVGSFRWPLSSQPLCAAANRNSSLR